MPAGNWVESLAAADFATNFCCRISDPEASKPEDWDEDAPREVEDEEAEKPEGWLDDEPLEIDDPGESGHRSVHSGKNNTIAEDHALRVLSSSTAATSRPCSWAALRQ